MEIQSLRARVQPALHQDFDAVREEFVAETGTDDPRAFVHHLREWELIPFDLANTLLIELAVERAPDEDEEEDEEEVVEVEAAEDDDDLDEEAQDPTTIMRWDEASEGEVDPDAATKNHDRAELMGWVDDPSEADDVGTLIGEQEGDDDEIDPEADTVHLDRRFVVFDEDGGQAAVIRRTPAGIPTRTPPPQVRDPAYVNTPGRITPDRIVPDRIPPLDRGTPPIARERVTPDRERTSNNGRDGSSSVSQPPTSSSGSPVSNRPVTNPPTAPRETPAPSPRKTIPPTPERSNRSTPPAAAAAEVPTLTAAQPSLNSLDLPPDPSGRYEFLDVIDEDGLARTVLAADNTVGRHVALRVMNTEVLAHAPLLQRFKTEARATSQLDHPGIPAVHDLRGPQAYFHRLIDGEPFATWLAEARAAFEARKPLPPHLQPDALLERFVQVCDILAHAHGRGIIHRDLRPDNILVGPFGATWVVDWGIALVVDESVPNPLQLDPVQEDRRVLVGTAGYCSPEQANGRQQGLDVRSDVYALGLLLFEILALKPAVAAPSVNARLARQQGGLVDPLVHAYGRPISAAMRAIVARATTRDPRERYPNAMAVAEDVRRAMRGQPISARGEGILPATGRLFARFPALVWAVMALLIFGWALTLFLAVVVFST